MIVSNEQALSNLSNGDQLSLLTDILVTLRTALLRGDDIPLSLKPASPPTPVKITSVQHAAEQDDSDLGVDTCDDLNTTVEEEEEDYYYDDYYEEEEIIDTFNEYGAELFTHVKYDKWKSMSETDVISDALISGNISLAVSFLKKEDEADMNFELFKSKAYLIVYNLLRSSEYNIPLRMLNNLGENIPQHLHEIAFNTIDSTMRNQLLHELQRLDALVGTDTELVDYVKGLEHLYTESKISTGNDTTNLLSTGNIDDLGRVLETEMTTAEKKDNYFVAALEWVRLWDQDTRNRVLLDKRKGDASLETQLRYYVAHHSVTGIESWIQNFKSQEVDTHTITPVVKQQLQYCTPYLVHILSIPELKLDPSFSAQLISLCNAGQLFTHNDNEFHKLFLEQMKEYPHLLSIYLEAHRLWNQIEMKGMMVGEEFDMFDLSLRNAEMLGIKDANLNKTLAENRPLIGLTTMMYSPVSLSSSLSASITSDHYINEKQLDKILSPYPTFHAILTPPKKITKFAPVEDDITLLDLIHDTHDELNFDFENVDYGDLSYHDDLDLEYYLCNGRAADAYQQIFGRSIDQLLAEPYFDDEITTGTNTDVSYILHFLKRQDENMYKQVQSIAIRNYTNEAITATCYQFLMLISTELSYKYANIINVETRAARKVNHKDVIKIFLEESPERMLPIIEQTHDWTLVHEYTKCHGLPLYTAHMIQLAQKADWSALLEEAQSNDIPRQVLVDIIRDYFPPSALCSHLYHAMNIPENLVSTDRANILLNHLVVRHIFIIIIYIERITPL
jgi:hypothetical protein